MMTTKTSSLPLVSTIVMLLVFTQVLIAEDSSNIVHLSYPVSPQHYSFAYSSSYQYLIPLSAYPDAFNIQEINAAWHWRIQDAPALQSVLRGGVVFFNYHDENASTLNWTHQHYYGALGLSYSPLAGRVFDWEINLFGGFSEGIFSHLLADGSSLGSHTLFSELGLQFNFKPLEWLELGLNSSVRYMYSLSALKKYDGFLLTIGAGASVNVGKTPAANRQSIPTPLSQSQTEAREEQSKEAQAGETSITAIKVQEIEIGPVFSAMQSYYARQPLGFITLQNNKPEPINDLDVSFFQPEYMSLPAQAATDLDLAPHAKVKVPLMAAFNEKIFEREGTIPLSGEITLRYTYQQKNFSQQVTCVFDLLDKTSLCWDDDRKVGAFITPFDSTIQEWASLIYQHAQSELLPNFNKPLQYTLFFYDTLQALGITYLPDPQQPFIEVQNNTLAIDKINIARVTLQRLTGDCDDLTVLFCTLLEAMGLETGFITVPGHIFPVFNTKVLAGSYNQLHIDSQMFLEVKGELWIPIEITAIGKEHFLGSWEEGIRQWRTWQTDPGKRHFYITREAQQVFKPVGLKSQIDPPRFQPSVKGVEQFRRDLGELKKIQVASLVTQLKKNATKEDYNRLGIRYMTFNDYTQAEKAFQQALVLDNHYLAARINEGHLNFYKKDLPKALKFYQTAYQFLDNQNGNNVYLQKKLLLCISNVYHDLQDYKMSNQYYKQALQIDPELEKEYAFLDGGARQPARRESNSAGKRVETLLRFME